MHRGHRPHERRLPEAAFGAQRHAVADRRDVCVDRGFTEHAVVVQRTVARVEHDEHQLAHARDIDAPRVDREVHPAQHRGLIAQRPVGQHLEHDRARAADLVVDPDPAREPARDTAEVVDDDPRGGDAVAVAEGARVHAQRSPITGERSTDAAIDLDGTEARLGPQRRQRRQRVIEARGRGRGGLRRHGVHAARHLRGDGEGAGERADDDGDAVSASHGDAPGETYPPGAARAGVTPRGSA